ncbi:MAG: hypothetical protein GXP37_01575 [Chloroflexi bacterium]|nr:hypothetical protein [Chloroflexota bacterium]
MIQRSTISSLQDIQAGVLVRSANTGPRQALLTILLIVGVTLILGLYIYQSAKITVVNYNIAHLQNDYAQLMRENTNILGQIAIQNSIRRMAKKAIGMGYQPLDTVNFLYVTAPELNAPNLNHSPPPTEQ